MIQRIQTVYLLLSALVLIVCLCLPIGTFIPDGMGGAQRLYNLSIIDASTGSWNFSVCGLFVILAATSAMTVMNVFSYNNRKLQIRECNISILLLILWMVLYAVTVTLLRPEGTQFEYGYAAFLPAVAVIFQWLARRGVIHDEELIRSQDRIR